MGWLRWAFVSSVILAVASCTSDERSRFEVVFRPASLAADVSRVELNLIRACADADPLRAPDVRLDTWTLEKGRPFEAPLAIGAGNYAIHARGIDSNCQVRAASCTPIRVRAGGGDTFTITLTQVTTAPACDGGERCENAACVTPDGGIDTDAGDGSAPSNTCQNERQDEDETDIDCGGECEPCDDNSTCDDDSDCASHWCDDGQCADTTACDDHPEALFCDGFETPAITDVWTQALVGVSPVVQDNAVFYRGRYAAKATTPGSNTFSYVEAALSETIESGHVYMRAYFYVPSNFTLTHIDLFALHNDAATTSADSGAVVMFASGGNFQVWIDKEGAAATGTSMPVPRDQWFCARVDFEYGTDETINAWLNDTQVYASPNHDTTVEGGFTRLWTPMDYIGKTQGAMTVYVDEIGVSRTPLPCLD